MIAERSDVIPILAETFRTHGYEGASLSVIGKATGLGKGSLYHFFPGGKEEMAKAVLDEIASWLRDHVFEPLREAKEASSAVKSMFAAVDEYFRGGGRMCVVGIFAVSDVRDRFSEVVRVYFQDWIDALASTLVRLGHAPRTARSLAEDAVASIQGGLVLARAIGDTGAFARSLERLQTRLLDVR
jgi:AcrR family transcriptional regulator